MNEELNELILRAKGDRSQNSFALHCDIDSATITKIIKNGQNPTPETLKKIANKAHNGVTYTQLMVAAGHIDSDLEVAGDAPPAKAKSPVYDNEALELMEEMHKRPELKVLFNTTKKAKKEDIEFADQFLKRMVENNYDD